MKTFHGLALAALAALALLPSRAGAQNLLANPGFEDPITYEGTDFIGSWEGFSGGAGSAAFNATTNPHGGTTHLDLNIANTDNTFAGVFQDVPVTAGQTLTLAGFDRTPSSPLDLTPEVRIEWRNAAGEVARTANLDPQPGPAYAPFSLTATVPAGADLARVVYAIQTFTGGPTNNGEVFIDDLSLTVVPEPGTAAMALIALGAFAATRRHRRRV
jgi:hypothetical protein